nr:hypothetical protein [Klebsiella pneumoniae]
MYKRQELKNRLLMAPMTTCTGYFDGTVTSELVEYYLSLIHI